MDEVELEQQITAPRKRRPLLAVAVGLIVLAAFAVPASRPNTPKTRLSNHGTHSAAPVADAPNVTEAIMGGDRQALDTASTTTTAEQTTTTVTSVESHVTPTTLDPLDPDVPDIPVVPDKLITEFSIPTKKSWPYGITAGPDGAVWFVENGSAAGYGTVSGIARVTLDGEITEYPVPLSGPVWITSGPDGALWFTKAGDSSIGRITTDGTVTKYLAGVDSLWSITSGPDGALWMTQRATTDGGFVIRMTTDGAMTKFKLPHDFAVSLAFGPDGDIWVADQEGFVERMTPAGAVTSFPIDWDPYGGYVEPIIAGPDGAMWFGWSGASVSGSRVGRITTDGHLSHFVLPTDGDPAELVSGPDGYIWLTMNNSNVIVRLAVDGATTAYAAKSPMGIAVGPDGNIWFTETQGNKVGRLSVSTADMFP